MTVLLEVCVDDAAGLDAAVSGGAGRIELCSALETGGLTPSAGFMRLARTAPVPVHALIRPRTGGFHYGAAELAAMADDIAQVRAAGLAGVAIGASRADGAIDWDAMRLLLDAAEGLAVTLHRAFDLVPDPAATLDQAVAAGIGRVLTSGGAASAPAGAAAIAAVVRHAAGRLIVMPGSGITPDNAAGLVRATGVREIHASCRAPVAEDARLAAMGFARGRRTDAGIVRALARLD